MIETTSVHAVITGPWAGFSPASLFFEKSCVRLISISARLEEVCGER